MRVLLDTNVVLDVLLNRKPWVDEAKSLWQTIDDERLIGYIAAVTLTNIFYIARRSTNRETAYQAIPICLDTFEICPVDRPTLEQAAMLAGQDFEDNVQIACATLAGLDAIVTRNVKDFAGAPVPVLTPAEALAQI